MGQCNFLHLWHQKLYRAFRFGTLWPISCSYPRHSQLTRHSLMLANGRIRQSLTALVCLILDFGVGCFHARHWWHGAGCKFVPVLPAPWGRTYLRRGNGWRGERRIQGLPVCTRGCCAIHYGPNITRSCFANSHNMHPIARPWGMARYGVYFVSSKSELSFAFVAVMLRTESCYTGSA